MKVTRAAFLYLDPKGDKARFAQCGTCMMFTGSSCTILGKDFTVNAGDTCGFYVHGKPQPAEKGHEMKSVTPEEAGFERRAVRCENCAYFEDEKSVCGLFVMLNEALPDDFDLDEGVDAFGCCNANVPKAKTDEKRALGDVLKAQRAKK